MEGLGRLTPSGQWREQGAHARFREHSRSTTGCFGARRNLQGEAGSARGGGTGARGGAGRGGLGDPSSPCARASLLRAPALLVPPRGQRRSNFARAGAGRTCPAQSPQGHGRVGLAAAAAPAAGRAAAPRRQVRASRAGRGLCGAGGTHPLADTLGGAELGVARTLSLHPRSSQVCFAHAVLPVLRTPPTSP